MQSENQKLNPRIAEVEIGVRQIRKIKIYPLSLGDQIKVMDMVGEALQAFSISEEIGKNDVAFVTFIMEVVSKNVEKILGLVTDETPEQLINELANDQLTGIIDIILDVNFLSLSKNVKSLFGKIQNIFRPERPLPQSAKPMDTDLKTSTEKVLKTEESPEIS